ncbi:hypothetical protein [Poritiphilus flavus]|uniref:Uncharacterized protein n=1 Tax=Poritiphilus flavus TaxID=2697053 RepID=A0A6L9EGT1_9FLAO|nr:hypothetical protein [Poritiphilus flavus]NAS13469.1 hypothetical protein [Poritiphilus flavus]
MCTSKNYFLSILFALLFIPIAEAQYGYGNNNFGRRGRSAIPQTATPERKAEPLTAEEIVANEMPKINEALELNDFEQAVVASILTKYIQQTIELRILDLEPDKMREGMEKIRKNQMAELKAGLPEDKYNALVELQEKGYTKVKKEKKKKKKKKKKKSES